MKKTYIKPEIDNVKLLAENNILVESRWGVNGEDNGIIEDNPFEIMSKDSKNIWDAPGDEFEEEE